MAAKIKINETGDCIYTEADVIDDRTKTELLADLSKFTAVRDGYTALRKSFETRFKQVEAGGRPDNVDINQFINVTPPGG